MTWKCESNSKERR